MNYSNNSPEDFQEVEVRDKPREYDTEINYTSNSRNEEAINAELSCSCPRNPKLVDKNGQSNGSPSPFKMIVLTMFPPSTNLTSSV